MKVTVNSPDGLGDFVLRLPLVEALLSAGHKLQLVMCTPAADLASDLFPETEVLVLKRDPFHAETKKQKQPFSGELAQIRRFGPELYVASTFSTRFFCASAVDTSALPAFLPRKIFGPRIRHPIHARWRRSFPFGSVCPRPCRKAKKISSWHRP